MALDTSREAMEARINALRAGYSAYASTVRQREQRYLKAYSPPYDPVLKEHDQWPDAPKEEDVNHNRASFNETRAVVEHWTSLETPGLKFPPVRFIDDFLLPPPPSMDEKETAAREQAYVARKLVARNRSSMREGLLARQIRVSRLAPAYFKTILRKNRSGHAWMRILPDATDETGHKFLIKHDIDNSTLIPQWGDAEEDEAGLDAILVVSRRSADRASREYPEAEINLQQDGLTVEQASYWQPTNTPSSEADRRFVWVEDYWVLDAEYSQDVDGGEPVKGSVINAVRVNGVVCRVTRYPGWKHVPYFHFHNDNGRDRLGFSDVATMLPMQDLLNRMLSEQSDVIHGESRPKLVHKTDGGPAPQIDEEGIIQITPDESLDQLRVSLDTFPTQVHGNQLHQVRNETTGLPDVAWGNITSAQNSGRALATAWKAVMSRLLPRLVDDDISLRAVVAFMLDLMELYDWNSAGAVYDGNRDFEIDYPNQEPRDFNEVTMDALNRKNGGILDVAGAMEATGVEAPDEMLERVRRDNMDVVLNPEKAQQYRMVQRLDQQMQLDAQNAAMQQQQQAAVAGQQAAANQAAAQAQQQAAPAMGPGQGAPMTQPGMQANPAQAQVDVSSMLQNGDVSNRMIVK